MEDTELTRKAIEELMKDMNEYKEMEKMPKERKKNPLGRPNKLFLGRTINSILTHNKRESDRTLQKCKRKLKELDEKKRKHKRKHRRVHHGKSESLHEDVGNCNNTYENKTCKNLNKNKKRRVKKRRTSTSSSSSSNSSSQIESNSSDRSLQHRNLNRKKKRHKVNQKEYHEQDFHNENNENTMEYYIDPNIAYAAMAYSQINHMMQQQMHQQQMLDKELEEKVTIPSDLSISCYSSSESSLNISLNSSSAEEDENGILTFKLSSGDDETFLKCSQEINKTLIAVHNNKKHCIVSEEIDKDSVKSYISLDSKDSQQSSKDILLLSSSSDSEKLESKDSQRSAFGDIYLLSSSSDS